jgi:hypothetical protein
VVFFSKKKPICVLTDVPLDKRLYFFNETPTLDHAWCIENIVCSVLIDAGMSETANEFYRRSQSLIPGLSARELFLERWILAQEYVEIR